MADVNTGRTEPLLPKLSVVGPWAYDVSPAGEGVVVAAPDSEGKSRLWLAPLDRSSPPRQIPNVQGAQPVFGKSGEIFFRAVEGNSAFVYRVRDDGTGLKKAFLYPVAEITGGVSPDGRYLIAWSNLDDRDQPGAGTAAFPLDGGSPVRIFGLLARLKWSRDGTLLYVSIGMGRDLAASGKTYAIPLPAGRTLPAIPPGGFRSGAEIRKLPGVAVIDAADVAPGPTAAVYAFSREATQRNLFRIPLP